MISSSLRLRSGSVIPAYDPPPYRPSVRKMTVTCAPAFTCLAIVPPQPRVSSSMCGARTTILPPPGSQTSACWVKMDELRTKVRKLCARLRPTALLKSFLIIVFTAPKRSRSTIPAGSPSTPRHHHQEVVTDLAKNGPAGHASVHAPQTFVPPRMPFANPRQIRRRRKHAQSAVVRESKVVLESAIEFAWPVISCPDSVLVHAHGH